MSHIDPYENLGKRDPWRRPYRPTEVTGADVSAIVLLGGAAGALAWLVLHILDLPVSLPLLVLFGMSVLATRRVVRATWPPPTPPPLGSAPASDPPPDRPFAAVSHWQDRLSWGEMDAGRFETGARPPLVALIDERLRQRHGVTRATHPERARHLLGEDLWLLATAPPGRTQGPGMHPADVRRLVQRIEQL